MRLKKTLGLIFAILIFFISLEISLFLAGQYFKYQIKNLNTSPNQNPNHQTLRIITLGESTTSDITLNGLAWPRLLVEVLKNKSIDVELVNVAIPASNGAIQIKEYLGQEKLKHFDLIIAMMGMGDQYTNFYYKNNPLYELRTLKYLKLLFKNMKSPLKALKTDQFIGLKNIQDQDQKIIEESINQFKNRNKVSETELLLEELVKKYEPKDQSQIYIYIASKIKPPWGEESKEFNESLKIYEKGMRLHAEPHRMLEFISMAITAQRKDLCELGAQAILKQSLPDPRLVSSLLQCLGDQNDLSQKLVDHLDENYEIGKNEEVLFQNYNYLLKESINKNSCLLMMQYPLLEISQLESYFQRKSSNLFFIENKENFELAVDKNGFDKIFYDRFAKKFGHTTQLGSQLIADQAAAKILALINSDQCNLLRFKPNSM